MANRATSAKVARSADLTRLLGDLGDWTVGPGPLFERLARSVAGAIERGEVAHGARLPSERALAAATWVSRGTVVAAYDLLVGEGRADRRGGSGTFVIALDATALPQGREGSRLVAHLAERADDDTADVIDLAIAVLDDPGELPEVQVATADLAASVPASGYDPRGLAELRVALADRLARVGLPAQADHVVVTSGAQQAISLAAACWVRPGDVVLVEDPTYPGALSAFAAAGATVVGLPVDGDGVRLGPLADALAGRPALVYLQSALHNPTGVVLSPSRRDRIAELLVRAKVPLVEDVALAGTVWLPSSAPIAARAPDHPVAVVGSVSKRFWSGLRVGYVHAPRPVAQRLARIKTTHDLGTSAVGQLLAARLLAHPGADAFVARRNEELRHRHAVLRALLARELPTWTPAPVAGGLSVWVCLPAPVADRFASVALAHGVAVAPAGSFSPGGGHADHLRLSVSASEADLRRGIARLASAWAAFVEPGSRSPSPPTPSDRGHR